MPKSTTELVTCPRCNGQLYYHFQACYLCDNHKQVAIELATAYRLLLTNCEKPSCHEIDQLRVALHD